MEKKKKGPHPTDTAGKALVADDSRTLREQGRGSIVSDILGS